MFGTCCAIVTLMELAIESIFTDSEKMYDGLWESVDWYPPCGFCYGHLGYPLCVSDPCPGLPVRCKGEVKPQTFNIGCDRGPLAIRFPTHSHRDVFLIMNPRYSQMSMYVEGSVCDEDGEVDKHGRWETYRVYCKNSHRLSWDD